MKVFYKRLLAVVLCLALTAAIVPATVFALRDIPDGLKPGDIVPGRVAVSLKEPYYGDLAELFPQLDIDSWEDLWLGVITVSPSYPEKGIPSRLKQYVGTLFVIDLTEQSTEAVYKAISLLREDPRVKHANPDGVVGPAVAEPEITVADALAVLRVAARLAEPTLEMYRNNDKDGDGEITVADALSVLRIAAGLA